MSDDVDNFLAHYGVKGMKWGERRAHTKNMRGLDKAERKKNREQHTDEVDGARARIKSGEAKQTYKAAKVQYKKDREVIGKVAARKALVKAQDQLFEDQVKSQEFRNGKELAISVLVAGGLALIVQGAKR